MKAPASFSTSNQRDLNSKCTGVNVLSLHSYEVNNASSAQGALILANAINDATRKNIPIAFNALVLHAIESSAQTLSTTLATINSACPLTGFINAAKMASSLANLEQDKFTENNGQPIEWQNINDIRALTPLKNAYVDQSKRLLANDGTTLVTSISEALTELSTLKTQRDNRLSETSFSEATLGININDITASNAANLASSIKALGNNDLHWAYVVFVGSVDELTAIKELFL